MVDEVASFTTSAEVVQIICNKTWSPMVFESGRRLSVNFAASSLCVLDVDDGLSLEDALVEFADFRHVIATTKSHQNPKSEKPLGDRYRVVLWFDEVIETREKFERVMKYYLTQWPFADPQCKDAARFYWACVKEASIREEGTLLSTSVQLPSPRRRPQKTNGMHHGTVDINALVVEKGGRNSALTSYAGRIWGNKAQTPDELEKLVMSAAKAMHNPLDERDVRTIVASVAKMEPNQKTPKLSKRKMVEEFLNTRKYDINSVLLTEEISNYIEVEWGSFVSDGKIDQLVMRHKNQKRNAQIQSYCITSGSPTKYITILDPLLQCDAAAKPYYNAVFLHAFQNIKRKMMKKKARMPLCPVLYGRQQGTGKSFFVDRFKDFFGELGRVADGGDLNDKWAQANVYKSFFVFLDEMAKMNKTDASLVKKVITEDTLDYRKFHGATNIKQKNLATFFGATNYSLEEVFGGIETSRRFVEIPVIDTRFPRDYVNNIDISDFWGSIDPEYEYLTADFGDKLLSEAAPIDSISAWLQNGFIQDDEKTKYTSAELHMFYAQYCKNNRITSVSNTRGSKNGFAARLKALFHSGMMKPLGCVRLNDRNSFYYFDNISSVEDENLGFSLAHVLELKERK